MSDDFKKLCGLWLTDGKNGKFMSGTLRKQEIDLLVACSESAPDGSVKLFCFKNTKREGKKDPDYRVSCAPCKAKQNIDKIPIDDDLPF